MSDFRLYFWVTNISDRNVSLTDLGLTIPARRSVNLLDNKHYHLTQEQLEASAASGSLFKKRSKVVVRKVPPVLDNKQTLEIATNAMVPSRRRSAVNVEQVHYEELDLPDDIFAQEMADLAEVDYTKK